VYGYIISLYCKWCFFANKIATDRWAGGHFVKIEIYTRFWYDNDIWQNGKILTPSYVQTFWYGHKRDFVVVFVLAVCFIPLCANKLSVVKGVVPLACVCDRQGLKRYMYVYAGILCFRGLVQSSGYQNWSEYGEIFFFFSTLDFFYARCKSLINFILLVLNYLFIY
jgi:hypothetical protein